MSGEPSSDAGGAVLRARTTVQSLYSTDRASQSLGIEILDVAPGRVRIAMTVRSHMVNGYGMCHGGIVFAFADSAFAFACNSYGEPMVAAGASIEFLAPTPSGERVTATATEVCRGARHGIYDVAVSNSAGEVLAQFRGRCSRLRAPTQTT
ncbi:MAG TPA: hydroxyphenylacetyl-CoA thioesterase PaaI [Steroidobacteraceae bacterium]|jgi:acyl-CoA thioesterase|nr:hydroxyphenylacetyl-CoA thioesterase PaaI [Steroidobacteraceae bacterium]